MKKGFTLLELIVVVIIIGILATLGFAQYGRMIERSRGAEARAILGLIRTQAGGYRLEQGKTDGFNNERAGIGTGDDQIPSECRGTHYFSYIVTSQGGDGLVATATRCTTKGKTPDAGTAYTLILTTDFKTGSDSWTGTGGY